MHYCGDPDDRGADDGGSTLLCVEERGRGWGWGRGVENISSEYSQRERVGNLLQKGSTSHLQPVTLSENLQGHDMLPTNMFLTRLWAGCYNLQGCQQPCDNLVTSLSQACHFYNMGM